MCINYNTIYLILQVFPTVINCIRYKANTTINSSQLWKMMLYWPGDWPGFAGKRSLKKHN